MALQRGQAWLTCVTRDETVTSALVLAESLRKNRTTRRIGVIISKKVSKESTQIIQKSFDDVFLINENIVSGDNDHICAKVFALSLEIFEKCVFLGPRSIVLENCDRLFDSEGIELYKDFSGDCEIFRFAPNLALCEFFQQNGHGFKKGDFSNTIQEWMKNNESLRKQKDDNEVTILKFSLESGRLHLLGNGPVQPLLGQFIDAPNNDVELMTKIVEHQKNASLELTEKALIREWLNVFESRVARTKGDPKDTFRLYPKNEPIAIVGMSCRFPGASNIELFWDLLYAGEESICKPPDFRWTKEQAIYGNGKQRTTEAGFLSVPVDEFDSKFFGMSPKDAELLDPQARLLHEVMWESLENGGIDPHSLYGSHTGIFTGSWMNDYKDIIQASTERDFFRTYMGNSIGATAARLSFLLGLTGPSIATESGCSSAIVALDLAVKSLRNGETDLAISGGVNLLLHPFESTIIDYVISPNGRCKTFDEKADGFGRAEGCGVLVLKRLSDALRDRDNIWAVIRGSAVSQEGISRSLGTPTVHCEALAMELAMKDGGIRPEQVTFVETHGTGTSVGDPMEVSAIAKAYHSERRKEPLVIGSVKTNVGHTESCSGITGIIKTILAMQHQLIPKHLNLDTLNPHVNLEAIPGKIPLEPMAWPKVQGEPRLAGVSSFGITGTDGHVIIEEPPDYQLPKFTVGLERPLHLIKFSAKTNEALDELIKLYAEYFRKEQGKCNDFADTAYTANIGRASFNQRAFLLASNYEQALAAIESNKVVRGEASVTADSGGKICFLFTGQGSQYPGMAKLMYETSPVFRLHFDQCDAVLKEKYNLSIRQVLWESDDQKSKELSRTIYSQTSIFVIEYCLLKLWESWGIKPDYVLGHSLGEFCAAVAAGILSFEVALMLVAERSRLIDTLPRGSMLVIKANRDEVAKLMTANKIDLDWAALNSNDQTVVAGDTEKVLQFLDICKSNNLKAIVLEASHAFHSRHMDPMLKEYKKIAETVRKPKTAKCQYISGMKGCLLKDPCEEINAEYWVQHTREKVSFLEACKTLRQLECEDYLEVGPQPVLSSFVMQNIEDLSISSFPSLRKKTNDWETILTSLGKLYMKGYIVNWKGYDEPYPRQKISTIPYYPLNRKSYWVDCQQANTSIIHPLVGHTVASATNENIFQNDVNLKTVPYLKDHCIGHMVVFPGAGFTEMCMTAGYCVANSYTETVEKPTRALAVENVKIEAPLEIKEGKSRRLQTIVSFMEGENSGFECRVYHQNQSEEADTGSSRNWVLHASAIFHPFVSATTLLEKWSTESTKVADMITNLEASSVEGFYKTVDSTGLKFGEHFRSLQQYWYTPQENGFDEIVAEMACPSELEKYLLHPLVIDTMMQGTILSGWRTMAEKGTNLRVPVRIGKLTLLNNIPVGQTEHPKLYLHVKWEDTGNVTVFVCTANFTPIAVMEDLELFETNVKTIQSVLESQNSKIPQSWEENWKPIHGPFDKAITLDSVAPIFSHENFQNELHLAQQLITGNDEIQLAQINRLLYLYTLKALFQLGWKPEVGEPLNVSILSEKCKILPVFNQLVRFYLTMLEAENYFLSVTSKKENGKRVWRVTKVSPDLETQMNKDIEMLYQQLRQIPKFAPTVEIYNKIATHLHEFLSGETSVLPVLFPLEGEENYAERQKFSADHFYVSYPGRPVISEHMRLFLRHMLNHLQTINEAEGGPQQKKIVRILEVGAGTGSMTAILMPVFKEILGTNFEYHFSDISQAFFSKAERKFEDVKDQLRFGTFNVEEPPIDQGVPVNYFDIVLATDVLHATKSLRETLRNIRQTMRPRGTIFFTDTFSATRDLGLTFVFGLLEGYWLYEDFETRKHHSCVDGGTWKRLMLEEGFDFVHTLNAYLGVVGFVTGVATDEQGYDLRVDLASNQKRKWVVFAPEKDEQLDRTIAAMGASGFSVSVVKPGPELDGDEETLGKMFGEIVTGAFGQVQGLVYAWAMDRNVIDQRKIALPFMLLAKTLLGMQKPPKLYVLTRGVQGITENNVQLNPSGGTLFGMTKTLKNENSELLVRIVDLEIGGTNNEVDQILYELAINKESRDKERMQVCYRDNVRYEPKFSKGTLAQNPQRFDLQLPPCAERYQLVLPQSKMINDLSFDVLEEDPVAENEVEVQIKAYALNFRDILTILKPIEEFENYNNVGLDFAGIVTRVGSSVSEDRLKVGDRVFGLKMKQSPLPSHVVMEAESLLKVPKNMTLPEAATLPAVFATSFYCLLTVARMKKGDTVLIHTGSGGVGLSAIQLAKHVGANIITTAGSPRKRAYLKSLGIEHVFHSRNTSYKEDILRVTNGRGVDIVLNSITGPGFKEATLEACAKNARFIEMSRLSVWSEEEVKQLRSDVEYTLVDLTKLDKSVWDKLLESIKSYLDDGHVTAIPFVQFDALRVRQALQFFQKAKHIGKLIVTMPEQRAIGGQWKVKLSMFNPEGTYLVTGGLGGIGFEVCKWMLERGATDVVLIGRTPPKQNIAQEIERLNQKGYNIMVKLVDVGDSVKLKAVINDIAKNCKPIRGIHHCAGVLADNMYANQTWSSFEATFTPKVKGTWNLHNFTLGMPLEYFIMYSSITAMVGTPSQANHAAANCFEDAFVHYRHAMGLPATTINWGQWSQVGVAREVNVSGVLPVSVTRMMNGLEEVLRSQMVQAAIGEFESLAMWNLVCPSFKYYLDERLLMTMKEGTGQSTLLLKSDQFWEEIDEADGKEAKMEVVMAYMKAILRNALRMEPDEPINNDVNMKDLGVDSLMLIELKNSIQGLLGSRLTITASMLQDCNSIRDLASCIVNKLYDDYEEKAPIIRENLSPEELLQLLKEDCILEQSIQPPTQPGKPSAIKSVLVTGCTGQLGPYVISSLCQNAPNLEKIYCLIRTVGQKCPKEKLHNVLKGMNLLDKVQMDKVECVKGDLIQPDMGLDPEKYAELASSVDAIIHLAAKSNHIESYRKSDKDFQDRDIRSVNVGGTLSVLKFASTSKTKHVYYASSIMCVFGGDVADGELCDSWPNSEEMHILSDNTMMGYAVSKYVSEMLLKQAVERGIPCKSFRFPWIMGESQTGQINFLHNHYILRFMSYLKIKVMPHTPLPAIILPVDTCADFSLKIFWDDNAAFEAYNIAHPDPQMEVEFVKMAKEEFGVDIELGEEWQTKAFMEKLYAKGMPLESFKEMYEDVDNTINLETSSDFRAIQGYLVAPEKFFKNKKVERLMPGFAQELPSTMEILKRNLVYVKKQGFFEKFGI